MRIFCEHCKIRLPPQRVYYWKITLVCLLRPNGIILSKTLELTVGLPKNNSLHFCLLKLLQRFANLFELIFMIQKYQAINLIKFEMRMEKRAIEEN